MACGGEHSLAATEAGDLFAWGWGRYGNLGIGPAEDRLLPSKVWGPPGAHPQTLLFPLRALLLSKGCSNPSVIQQPPQQVSGPALAPRSRYTAGGGVGSQVSGPSVRSAGQEPPLL